MCVCVCVCVCVCAHVRMCVCVCMCVCGRTDIVRIWKCLGVSRTGITANQKDSQKLKI